MKRVGRTKLNLKKRNMNKKRASVEELRQALEVFGFDLVDVSGDWRYSGRAGKTYAVQDQGRQLCSYSTHYQIREWVRRSLLKDYERIQRAKD